MVEECEAGTSVALELERHASGDGGLQIEQHRQVHEHHMVLGDVEVVHHHHVRNVDTFELGQRAVRSDTDIAQVRRFEVQVTETDEFTGDRADLRMRGEPGGEGTATVLIPDRVQVAIETPRPMPLFKAQQ